MLFTQRVLMHNRYLIMHIVGTYLIYNKKFDWQILLTLGCKWLNTKRKVVLLLEFWSFGNFYYNYPQIVDPVMLQMIWWHRKKFLLHSLTKNHANDDVINNVKMLDETSIATTHKQLSQGETPTTVFDLVVERKKIYVLQSIKSIFLLFISEQLFCYLVFLLITCCKSSIS